MIQRTSAVKSVKTYEVAIPEPMPVSVSIHKTALVIVDMQNDFCLPNGQRFLIDTITPTIPRIKNLLVKARANGMRVILTQSWYPTADSIVSEHPRVKVMGSGCEIGTWGAEIIDELKPLESESVIKKGSYDPWFGTRMEDVLRKLDFGNFEHDFSHKNRIRNDCSVIITGTISDCCVDKAVIGFFLRGYHVIIPKDCISARSEFAQDSAVYRFATQYFGTITRSDLIEFEGSER